MNSHCQCPLWVQILAGLAFAYLIASVIYIMVTRRSDTPFKNSLSPEGAEDLVRKQSLIIKTLSIYSLKFLVTSLSVP